MVTNSHFEFSQLAIYETPAGDCSDNGPTEPILVVPYGTMKAFFGFYGKQAVFLDKDLWTRSIDLSKAGQGVLEPNALRHFLIPQEFIGGNNGLDGMVTAAGTVVFPKEGEVAAVSHALEWSFVG